MISIKEIIEVSDAFLTEVNERRKMDGDEQLVKHAFLVCFVELFQSVAEQTEGDKAVNPTGALFLEALLVDIAECVELYVGTAFVAGNVALRNAADADDTDLDLCHNSCILS